MSRLDFRTPVALPRPRSAVAMVALATLTLAITGQIASPALVLSALALGFVALRGESDLPWRRNAWLLNGGLALCVAVGAALFVRGALALVALAHFAVLAQALQLLDARPRRSEFLLVALSVFQVTMAANLTDSAFYPLLLVAFALSCVWTLVVHTLRAEALEAGELGAAQRILTLGLWRTTLYATLASILFAALLFPILPRIRSGVLFSRAGGGLARSGFSDQVELGDIGRIRKDASLALRVETLEGEPLPPERRYWRGIAFDRFDGRRWSVTPPLQQPVFGDPEIGIDLGGQRARPRIVQRIAREGMTPGVVLSAGMPMLLRGSLGRLSRDANGTLYAAASADKRVLYVLSSRSNDPRAAELGEDRAVPPRERGERYLQLPTLVPEVGALAKRIAPAGPSDAERVLAVERYLQRNGRYTDTPPPIDEGRSPIEQFLLDRQEGHCEYFASAMVVLLRSVGIPARLVNGFAGGHANSVGGFIEVAQSDAHAWVEVHYARAGWVAYDPTPADLRLASSDALRGASSLADLASALELWWFQNVVDFDRGHQARALRALWLRWHQWRAANRERSAHGPRADDGGPSGRWVAGAVGLAAALGLALRALRRRRAAAPAPPLPRAYARALRTLRRRGIVRAPATSARSFAAQAAAKLPPDAAAAFSALTEAYLAERFGDAG